MPTPREWTRRAADILLDERNKRYLGMTEPPTPVTRCVCGDPWPCDPHADPNFLPAADPSGLRAALGDWANPEVIAAAREKIEGAVNLSQAFALSMLERIERCAALAAKDSGSSDPEPTPSASDRDPDTGMPWTPEPDPWGRP